MEYTRRPYERLKTPIQEKSDQIVDFKLQCFKENCRQYIKGKLGYNGSFTAEDGTNCDLRNQMWLCDKHQKVKK